MKTRGKEKVRVLSQCHPPRFAGGSPPVASLPTPDIQGHFANEISENENPSHLMSV